MLNDSWLKQPPSRFGIAKMYFVYMLFRSIGRQATESTKVITNSGSSIQQVYIWIMWDATMM